MNLARVGRLFVGVPIPEEVREGLDAHLRATFGGKMPGKAVPPRNWHLTLRFLGDADAERHRKIVEGLRRVDAAAFDLEFAGLGAFPRPARASVLWVGVGKGGDELSAIAATVDREALAAGFAAEEQEFAPHLTISRVSPPADLRAEIAQAPPFDGRMRVESIVLFRSHMGAGPPRYEEMEVFPLA